MLGQFGTFFGGEMSLALSLIDTEHSITQYSKLLDYEMRFYMYLFFKDIALETRFQVKFHKFDHFCFFIRSVWLTWLIK